MGRNSQKGKKAMQTDAIEILDREQKWGSEMRTLIIHF
jgi:hypothetical protein